MIHDNKLIQDRSYAWRSIFAAQRLMKLGARAVIGNEWGGDIDLGRSVS